MRAAFNRRKSSVSTDTDIQADIDAVLRIGAVPKILEVVCRATGMGFAAIARVTDERWVCCAVRDEIEFGLTSGGELAVETTLCHEVRQAHKPVVIDEVTTDAMYSGHHTPAMYGFQSYISMPIILPDGTMFGTLCAIDPRPARLNTPGTIGMFKLFAELIATHLATGERMALTEATLLGERATSELREQFIAVLGHDLRNPLASIAAGTSLLRKAPTEEKAAEIALVMQNSVDRMVKLIDDVMDFARGRLGGGLTLVRDDWALAPILEQIVAEIRAASPAAMIETDFHLGDPVNCDRDRLGQLFSNLLGNAVGHGAQGVPVFVTAVTRDSMFNLEVRNTGNQIPAEAQARLFQPFSRGDIRSSQEGLGLGLYIASEIARAHGGTLQASSTPERTIFTFRMPLVHEPA